MKRILALCTLLFLLLVSTPVFAGVITVDAFLSADDVTINHLEQFRTRVVDAINNADGANIQNQTIPHTALDANSDPVNRWSESFNNYVYTGLLPTTGSRSTATISAGTAYIQGMRVVKDEIIPGAINYPVSSDVYVDLSSNGTYTYPTAVIGGSTPAVTANSIRLAKVTTNATDVTTVVDDRVTSISLNTEDYYIVGSTISPDSTTQADVLPGFVRVGATSVAKPASTTLDISVAGDYVGGVSQRGTSKWLYVYMNTSGSVKLEQTAPVYHSISGSTTGTLYYYKDTSNAFWRCLGAIRLNGTGSGEIDPFFQNGNLIMWDVPVNLTTTVSDGAWSSALSCASGMPAISTRGIFGLCSVNDSGDSFILIRPNGSTWVASPADNNTSGASGIGSGSVYAIAGQRICMTDSSQQIQHYGLKNSGTITMAINQEGYYLNIR